jgi:hypothetical protein
LSQALRGFLSVIARVAAQTDGSCKVAVQAQRYDRFAVAYCGGPETADTNFPPSPELLQSLGEKVSLLASLAPTFPKIQG